jgi:Helix-turn-helix domain
MESVFEIIAEPNRRVILSLLVSSLQSVGEIERQLCMTQPTVSKHLRVLREAGFVESTGSGSVGSGPLTWRLSNATSTAWNGPFRWLTVGSPEEPDGTELQLALNDKERIKARSAEFTMPPTDVTGSAIAMLKDTCGNLIQLTQLARYSR